MEKKRRGWALIAAMAVISLGALLFVPRFGWVLGDVYYFSGSAVEDGRVVATYTDYTGYPGTIKLAYEGRFSREIEQLRSDGKSQVFRVGLDGRLAADDPLLVDPSIPSFLVRDSSGFFYYRYFLVIGCVIGYAVLLRKGSQAVHFLGALVLFVLSMMLSLRLLL